MKSGNIVQEEREPEILEQLDRVNTLLGRQQELIPVLIGKLDKITRPGDENATADTVEKLNYTPQTTIGRELASMATRLEDHNDNLRAVTELIEL